MEALQMLKFALKKDRLDFTAGWITPISAMVDVEVEADTDLLASLLDGHEEALDNIIVAIGLEDDNDPDEIHNAV
jgi:hypothetical protein